jgi:pimeloyl-ACP methyl ester carboxylesterase
MTSKNATPVIVAVPVSSRKRPVRAGPQERSSAARAAAISSASWEPVMAQLGRHFTVIAPDLLGHGDSDKPRADYSLGANAALLRDLLVALGYASATIVVHSLGGGIAMQFAYQFPERIERLVLVSAG